MSGADAKDATARVAFLRDQIAASLAHNRPENPAVAVSGGGDSLALLCLMAEWASSENLPLRAVTVDHGLRAASADEARFVGEICAKLGVSHSTLKWTDWDGRGNLQDAARRARYRLMAEWAKAEGVDAISIAHTADDQAETFFMRLTRAAGIDGLTGMQQRRVANGVTWLRPLLMAGRDELREYLRDMGQEWIDDPSNEDLAFDRVKARKVLKELAPLGLDPQTVGRVMSHLSDVRAALDYATRDHALGCVTVEGGDLVIDRRQFGEAAPEVKRRLIAHALRWIASSDYTPRGVKVQEFLSAVSCGRDATLHGVRLLNHDGQFRLVRELAAVTDDVQTLDAVWDGRWIVAWTGKPVEKEGVVVRALGEDGMAQLPERPVDAPPRDSLLSSPALFAGDRLCAAPLAQHGPASARLIHPADHFFTSLLSH